MQSNLKYAIVDTPFGHVLIIRSEKGLRSVSLPQLPGTLRTGQTLYSPHDAEEDLAAFSDLPLRLQRYYGGEAVGFPDEIDYEDATAFERVVWGATRTITYGSARSYGWVAAQIGMPRAWRAVGRALGRNPLAIVVPCHRVVSTGGLGGFGGGLALKKRLLALEAGA